MQYVRSIRFLYFEFKPDPANFLPERPISSFKEPQAAPFDSIVLLQSEAEPFELR
ncbi:MAG: hypothetical protein J2P21_20170 [Chloracidobacterium sp.]|nr:hypothetical protein [Chloracidobacterium sp.]